MPCHWQRKLHDLRLPWYCHTARTPHTNSSPYPPTRPPTPNGTVLFEYGSYGYQAHMAWNPSGTHLAIGHTGTTLDNNWAATIIGVNRRTHPGMKLRSDRHNK